MCRLLSSYVSVRAKELLGNVALCTVFQVMIKVLITSFKKAESRKWSEHTLNCKLCSAGYNKK